MFDLMRVLVDLHSGTSCEQSLAYFHVHEEVASNLSYHFPYLHFTSSLFVPDSLFASATAGVRRPPVQEGMRVYLNLRHKLSRV